MITAVLAGDQTPEEAAKDAQDKINNAIENMETRVVSRGPGVRLIEFPVLSASR